MKNVLLSTLLSVIYPGIGQIYNRQKTKGFIFVAIQLLLTLLNTLALGKMELLYNGIWVLGILDALIYSFIKERNKKNNMNQDEYVNDETKPWKLIIITTVIAYLLHYGIVYTIATALTSPQDLGLENKQIKTEVQTYLEKKYHKKFIVDKVKYIPEVNAYQMVVHAIDNPNLHFPVTKDDMKGIVDGYVERLWVAESTKEVTPIVKHIYPKYVNIESAVGVNASEEKKIIKPPRILSYKEYRKGNKGYVHDLRIYVIKDVDPTEEKQNLFNLITQLRKRGITEIRLNVQFFDPSLLNKGVKSVSFDTQSEYYPYQTYILFVTEYDVDKIRTVDDLDEFFKPIQ